MLNIFLNIFKVNLEKINLPKYVYIYRIEPNITEENKLKECFIRLGNNYGYMDIQNRILYAYREVDYVPDDIKGCVNIYLQKKLLFNDLKSNQYIGRSLLRTFIRNTLKMDIKNILKSLERTILDNKIVGKWKLSLDISRNNVQLLEINGQFYAVINIKLTITANKNLWDLIDRDIRKLKKLKWSPENSKDIKIWFKYAPDIKIDKETSYILVDVIDKNIDEKTFEKLKNYPITKKRLTENELKELANYSNFDENQPIIKGRPNSNSKKIYSFLPQYCIPGYDVSLASKDEKDTILEISDKINFKMKAKIIEEIFNRLEYLELPNDSNIMLNKLDSVKLKARFVKVKLSKNGNKIFSKVISEPYVKEISSTFDLFRWIGDYWNLKNNLKNYSKIVEIPIPDYIPGYLKDIKTLETFLLLEENFTDAEYEIYRKIMYSIIEIYNIIRDTYTDTKIKVSVPYLNFKGKSIRFKNTEEGIDDVITQVCEKFSGNYNNLKFAFIFGKSKNCIYDDEENGECYDYYNPLKSKLFINNILSQNFIIESYLSNNKKDENKKIRFALSNIIYNIFSKLGIKFIVLEEKMSYDYVLGLDVGYGEAYSGRVAGCTTIHDSEGRLKNIIPISKENMPNRESARIKALLEEIESKYGIYRINFKNKNILILRDGVIQNEEIEQLKSFSKKKNCRITVIGIKKNTPYQIFDKNSKSSYYIKVGESYLLKSHHPKRGYPRAVKIDQKVEINNGEVIKKSPTENDILLIYKLTALNYSAIGNPSNLRIPSPIYYADKLVKALKRGWKIKEDFLKDGVLYFI
ncbi:Piwi domain-containing protein [Methanocaldococcus sp.]